MMLKILLPAEVMLTQEVKKIIAEAENGSFCLMPNHIDFVATLAPGIFTYEPAGGGQELLAMDVGMTIRASGAGVFEDHIGVALSATHLFMHPTQRIPRLVMIEFRL